MLTAVQAESICGIGQFLPKTPAVCLGKTDMKEVLTIWIYRKRQRRSDRGMLEGNVYPPDRRQRFCYSGRCIKEGRIRSGSKENI